MKLYAQLGHCAFAMLVIIGCLHQTLNNAAAQEAQLYFFTNANCGPCKAVQPEVEALYRNGYSVMKIDTSIHPDWTKRFQVDRTPTVILTQGNQIAFRKSGYVTASEMQNWFKSVESTVADPSANRHPAGSSSQPPLPNTFKNGSFHPESQAERIALAATVRLKIEDPLGSSFATGTIIHSLNGEALVLTCGHAFRDSKGQGIITAEYSFDQGTPKTARGELIFYDSDARDIGLVAIATKGTIQPVSVAKVDQTVNKQDSIFSIGCDQGDRPSIRRSLIKNQAKYDGVEKYEIYGRPVNGRSGGGLFNQSGELVGVCNAAVVDVDEGVYVALDTIYWQFDQSNLAHLFSPRQLKSRSSAPQIAADLSIRPATPRSFDQIPVRPRRIPSHPMVATNEIETNTVSQKSTAPSELIVVLRNQDSGNPMESWTIENPSDELIDQLKRGKASANQRRPISDRMAELRRSMPNLPQSKGKNFNPEQMRAQSRY